VTISTEVSLIEGVTTTESTSNLDEDEFDFVDSDSETDDGL
jgi:hypothetical protein